MERGERGGKWGGEKKISSALPSNFDDRRIQQLKAVDRALKKIDNRKYGLCEMCGKKIGKKRLVALPLTHYFRVCQSEIE